ncbi:MAG TPA: isochorismatase family protein [Candidatus Merdenecus merdavium]|nr:isochorismatase family protein [Candidatus Merdenecus merdavium]
MRIEREHTVALAIDFQEKLMAVMDRKEELLKHSQILLKGLQVLGIKTFITQQYTKKLGMSIPEIYDAVGTKKFFDKTSFSCYLDPDIKQVLDKDVKTVIICGIEAHICVLQTVLDLLEKGFQVVLVVDCISSRKESDMEIAIKRAIEEGAMVTTYEAILFELLQSAKAKEFKEISKLIK